MPKTSPAVLVLSAAQLPPLEVERCQLVSLQYALLAACSDMVVLVARPPPVAPTTASVGACFTEIVMIESNSRSL